MDRADARLRARYILQSAVTFERQLSSNTTAAVTYDYLHGVHLPRSRDINAPASSPLFLIESTGAYNQNRVIADVSTRVGRRVSLCGFYALNRAVSDTVLPTTAPPARTIEVLVSGYVGNVSQSSAIIASVREVLHQFLSRSLGRGGKRDSGRNSKLESAS